MSKGFFIAVVLGCLGAGLANWVCASDPKVRQTSSQQPSSFPVLEYHQLPYEGFGSVVILDDGALVITLGGNEKLDPESGEWLGDEPEDVVFLQINVDQDWRLNRSGRELFLDRSTGVEQKRRVLKAEQVNTTNFKKNSGTKETAFALHTLSGQLSLHYEPRDSHVRLLIDDVAQSGLRFSMNETLGTGTEVALPHSKSAEQIASPGGGVDGPALISIPHAMLGSDCSANCTGGSCNISCGGEKGCKAYCNGSTPVCRCGA